MAIYVIRDGELVEKTVQMEAEAPNVIRDEIEPLMNHADGKRYTSKARFRQATRDAGCIEIGNETPVVRQRPRLEPDRRQRREDIRRAINDLRDGRAPSIRQIIDMNKE